MPWPCRVNAPLCAWAWPWGWAAWASAFWQLLIAAVPITATALYFGDSIAFMPSWPSIAVITYIAPMLMPMPSAFGNVVWFSIVRVLPANVAALSW